MKQLEQDKLALIREIMSAGRFAALYELVARISPYNVSVPSGRDMSDSEQDAWQHACMHLEFLAKYGPNESSVKDGKFLRFSYPSEFEAWLQAGAQGVSTDELKAYLLAHPI